MLCVYIELNITFILSPNEDCNLVYYCSKKIFYNGERRCTLLTGIKFRRGTSVAKGTDTDCILSGRI